MLTFVLPYRQPYASIAQNEVFNTLLLSARIMIEHVNGILKSTFASLKGLSTQIRDVKDLKKVSKWVLVCLILHNLMIQFHDLEWERDGEDADEVNEVEDELLNQVSTTAQERRARVQVNLLQWFYARNAA